MKDSLYYASDKSISDALQNRKFKNSQLQELFYSRGVLLSKDTSRERLARYFGRLNHDYYDHQEIAKTFGSCSGREKLAMTIVNNEFSPEDILSAFKSTQEKVESTGENAKLAESNVSTSLELNYSVFDANKTPFKQIVRKEGIITAEKTDEGIVIRYPDNPYIEEIKDSLLDEMASRLKAGAGELGITKIELTSIENASDITDFFTKLMEGLPDFRLDTVTGVSIYNSAASPTGEGVSHVQNVAMKGKGVSNSKQLDDIIKQGFYICSVTWECSAEHENSDMYILEAKFNDPSRKSGFSYLAKSMRKCRGGGDYNKTTTRLSQLDEIKLSRLIEHSARNAMKQILATNDEEIESN
jgi:hypothetical protein